MPPEPRPEYHREEPTPIQKPIRQRREAEIEDSREFFWDNTGDSYDNEMERQLEKIEATKREAARLKSEATQEDVQSTVEIGSSSKRRRESSFGSVRSSLRDPSAARSAFIYGEVLGPPVSLRKNSGVPGLNS